MADLRMDGTNISPQSVDAFFDEVRPGGSPRPDPHAPGAQPGQPGVTPGQSPLMPDVLTGKDPSQLVAAEHLRTTGGASATEMFLGLDLQPTIPGAFPAPPGNREVLRHMSPTRRRTIIRSLLQRQRERMKRLAMLIGEDADEHRRRQHPEDHQDEQTQLQHRIEARRQRASYELGSTAELLDLLDDLLEMQDYTLSQQGSFSRG